MIVAADEVVAADAVIAGGTVIATGVVVATSLVDVPGWLSKSVDDIEACRGPWRVGTTAWTTRCTVS